MQAEIVREWLTYKEAELLVGLSRTTLWKLVSAGEIEYRKVGRAVRIHRRSLQAYMSGDADTSGESAPARALAESNLDGARDEARGGGTIP